MRLIPLEEVYACFAKNLVAGPAVAINARS